jgi:hypothetical protein
MTAIDIRLLHRLERLRDESALTLISKAKDIPEWKLLEHSGEKSVLSETDKRELEDLFRGLGLWDGDRFEQLFPEEAANEEEEGGVTKDAKVEEPGEID